MKLHNSGLCNVTVVARLKLFNKLHSRRNGVDRNITDACDKLQLDFNIKPVLNDMQ